ncbi:thiamine phosphate synthase [Rubinisphaera margarita]|uniref:thiamine phosphate synthase n=1 Tax=Rubinisphaera margarita TaxID=2909586 RepID=UPI001EE91C07|nr:thiamine phosphate synthase [Rubinisphaera margarita]MCG6156825.1 thiamine phosphate synthase [Rubinisphaera margarita]
MSDVSPSRSSVDERAIWRILDAAANRLREGLRVVEDFVRFQRNDPRISGQLKQLRHDFQSAWSQLDAWQLVASRDTPGDVGTTISTSAERSRSTLQDVIAANCKRVEESLRTLEEFSKLISPAVSAQIEQLRYRFYSIEQSVLLWNRRHELLAKASIYFLLTEKTCARNWQDTAREAVAAGVDVIQLREKSLDDGELLKRARWVREITAGTETLFIMNDRPDIALLSEADGVHVGQEELPPREVRQLLGADRLIGVSTHDLEQARAAVAEGADYLGVGPVFVSGTKTFDQFAGPAFVQQATKIELPWFAIGGIHLETLPQAVEAGATRVAVCQVLSQSVNLRGTVEKMRNLLLAGNNSMADNV